MTDRSFTLPTWLGDIATVSIEQQHGIEWFINSETGKWDEKAADEIFHFANSDLVPMNELPFTDEYKLALDNAIPSTFSLAYLDILQRALTHSRVSVRVVATQTCERVKWPECLPSLRQVEASDPDEDLRELAAAVCERIETVTREKPFKNEMG